MEVWLCRLKNKVGERRRDWNIALTKETGFLILDGKLVLDSPMALFTTGILCDWKNYKLNIPYLQVGHIYILFLSVYSYVFSINFVLGTEYNKDE